MCAKSDRKLHTAGYEIRRCSNWPSPILSEALCCFLPSNRLPLAESELLVPDNPHLTHAAGNGRAVGRTPRWRALASSLVVGAAVKFIFHRSKRISPNLVALIPAVIPPSLLNITFFLVLLFSGFQMPPSGTNLCGEVLRLISGGGLRRQGAQPSTPKLWYRTLSAAQVRSVFKHIR
jgi:hypothetical protein